MVQKKKKGCCDSGKVPKPKNEEDMMMNLEEKVKSVKVIIMGNMQVGKTCIIKSYMENQSMRGKHISNTANIVQDFVKTVNVELDSGLNQRLKLNIWDAAGD